MKGRFKIGAEQEAREGCWEIKRRANVVASIVSETGDWAAEENMGADGALKAGVACGDAMSPVGLLMPMEGAWRGVIMVVCSTVIGGSGLMSKVSESGEVSMTERSELNEDTSIC